MLEYFKEMQNVLHDLTQLHNILGLILTFWIMCSILKIFSLEKKFEKLQ